MFPMLLLCLIALLPHSAFSEELLRQVPSSRAEIMASYAPLVKKVTPAVVNIYTKKKVRVRSLSPFFNDPIFKQFLGEEFQGGLIRERIESSLGSGVIVTPKGIIITNNHVVKDADEVTVVLSDRREFPATLLFNDAKVDLALLKIDTDGEALPYLTLADSDKVEVGDLVLAIGNPFGVGQTVTSGIVSALARSTAGVTDFQSFIQTDAAINPGNSGGALVDMQGRLVGINTAIYSSGGGSNGVGFATPSKMVSTVLTNVKDGKVKKGQIIRPWLGAATQRMTSEIATSLGMRAPVGVLITKIYPGGPADEGGLKTGDVVVAVDGHEIADEQSLKFRIATKTIGSTAEFKVIRKEEDETKELIKSIPMSPPSNKPQPDLRELKGRHPFSGTRVANLSPALADELGLPMTQAGVIVLEVMPGDFADQLGVNKGDIIVAVNGTPITSTAQLQQLLSKPAPAWKLSIQRGNKVLNVAVRV